MTEQNEEIAVDPGKVEEEAKNKEDYAIVVGINRYSQLRQLKGAHKDANKFAAWLQSPTGGGLPTKNVKLILSPDEEPSDPFDARPYQQDIDKALRDFGILKGERIGRRLYFYFAGHGVGPSFDNVGMLMAHASMQALNASANIGLRPYRSYFRDHHYFDELVFILDCCRDPAFTVTTSGPPFNVAPGHIFPVEDFVVLAAAYGEKAFEPTSKVTGERRGLLTEALMEALEKPVAADSQGNVTTSSLREYLKTRVSQLATESKLTQAPEIPYLPKKDIIFCSFPKVDVNVHIVITQNLNGDIILLDKDSKEIARHPASVSQSPWQLQLTRNNLYALEIASSTNSGEKSKGFTTRGIKEEPLVISYP